MIIYFPLGSTGNNLFPWWIIRGQRVGNLSQKRNRRIAKSNKGAVIALLLVYGTSLIKAKPINFPSHVRSSTAFSLKSRQPARSQKIGSNRYRVNHLFFLNSQELYSWESKDYCIIIWLGSLKLSNNISHNYASWYRPYSQELKERQVSGKDTKSLRKLSSLFLKVNLRVIFPENCICIVSVCD